MLICCKRQEVLTAVQFNYVDDIEGPQTREAAQKLGLSTNGNSVLWEIKLAGGWCIVPTGSWILYSGDIPVDVVANSFFEKNYAKINLL